MIYTASRGPKKTRSQNSIYFGGGRDRCQESLRVSPPKLFMKEE